MNTKTLLLGAAAVVMVPVVVVTVAFFGLMALAGAKASTSGVLTSCTAPSEQAAATVPLGSATVALDAKQVANAATVIAVGRSMNVPDSGITVALMTALQESRLRMLANPAVPASLDMPNQGQGHDHDSVNMFQQRPSSGWGSVANLMDPTYAARAFFGGPQGPNHGHPRGLLDVPGWQSMLPGQAAQAVQVSADPGAYTKWQAAATQLLDGLSGAITCDGGQISANAQQVAKTLVQDMTAGKLTTERQAEHSQIVNMANGTATPACRIDVAVLQIIAFAVQHFPPVRISSLNRRCTDETPGIGTSSYHWKGQAVDFSGLRGHALTGADPDSIKLAELLDPIVPHGEAGIGQSECRASAGDTLWFKNFIQFPDTCNHLHVEVRQADHPLDIPSS